MRAVVQRVKSASVEVADQIVGRVGQGILVFIGVAAGDSDSDAEYLAAKTAGLRIFEDEQGKMNRSVMDISGEVLAISQFTLFGDVRKGKRPSFTAAAAPKEANDLYESYCQKLRGHGLEVGQGVFQADMQVSLVNDGPVTILLDSRKLF